MIDKFQLKVGIIEVNFGCGITIEAVRTIIT